MSVQIYPDATGALVVRTPYHPDFVYELKRYIPAADRRFDPTRKVWLVTADHASKLTELVQDHFGQSITIPKAAAVQVRPETKILEVRYIGACKDRGGGEPTAYGWSDGGWNVILPEPALRDWFGQQSKPGELLTLYAVLSVKADAGADEIKSAYRRMARQWHPDVCKEPDAAEQFRAIQHAYEVLREDKLRRRYDAGLKLTGQQTAYSLGEQLISYSAEYRSPLRCGLILAEGVIRLGKFSVGKIYGWHDITDSHGRTLSTSWPRGADIFEEEWIQ